jgi:hypothetical protein
MTRAIVSHVGVYRNKAFDAQVKPLGVGVFFPFARSRRVREVTTPGDKSRALARPPYRIGLIDQLSGSRHLPLTLSNNCILSRLWTDSNRARATVRTLPEIHALRHRP